MNNCSCNKCNACGNPLDCCAPKCDPCDPCGRSCCKPAEFDCDFNIIPDPYDPSYWFISLNGCQKRVHIPSFAETPTSLVPDCSSKTLTYYGENDTQIFTGAQLGCLINFEDLADVNISDPEPCSIPVFNPGCGECPCDPGEATWQAYTIPDAGDCEMEPDEDGYYKVLTKNDCGCIEECRMPVLPTGMTAINYVRDSVPDDPDFPWYYGCYNDTINLYLEQNAPQYFGKYALKVTINYGVQTIMSSQCKNVNFRSLLVPVVEGETINVEQESSILQGNATASASPEIPWSTQCLRGSFTFIVPKGEEAYLHHEWRYRSYDSFPNYYTSSTYDGVRVPDEIASQINALPWNASRLNALQVLVEPTQGVANYEPVTDEERSQLDDPVDEYPTL